MIYEFITYPHEVCYRPVETIGHAYQVSDFVEQYVDGFSFQGMNFACNEKVTRDKFDEICSFDDTAISFVKSELKSICDLILDSVGSGQYCFNLHNQDKDEKGVLHKAHFHVIFIVPDDCHFSVNDFYDRLGMFGYVSDNFEKRGKVYTRWLRVYPRQPLARVMIWRDFMRSARLRYQCHLDNPEKFQYSLSDPISTFDYFNDPDVLARKFLNPYALFFSLKDQNHLNTYQDYITFLACSNLPDDVLKQLKSIKNEVYRYFVSVYYEKPKKTFLS